MKQFLKLLQIESRLSLRCPDGILFGIGMPVGVLLLIGVIAKDQAVANASYTFLQSAFPSLITVGICATAFMGLPLTFAEYRDKKILKHFFVTPVSPVKMLLVQVIIAMIVACVSALFVTLIAITCFEYQLIGNLWLFLAAYFFVMVSMYSIGMILASLCPSVRIANIVTTIVYFPMLFLSGATIPFELFPNLLQEIGNVLPLTLGIKLLKMVSMNTLDGSCIGIIAVLSITAIIGVFISIKTFKWE